MKILLYLYKTSALSITLSDDINQIYEILFDSVTFQKSLCVLSKFLMNIIVVNCYRISHLNYILRKHAL